MIQIPDSIFPTNDKGEKICPKCSNVINKCSCISLEQSLKKEIRATLRLDKKDRRGKIITIIDHLPKNEQFLKDLSRRLKGKLGVGGKFLISNEYGVIEIQGNKINILKSLLRQEGISFRS